MAASEAEEFEFRRRAETERPAPRKKQSGWELGTAVAATAARNFIPGYDEAADALQAGVNLAAGRQKSFGDAWDTVRGERQRQVNVFADERPLASAGTKGVALAGGAAIPVGNAANIFAAPVTVMGRAIPQVAVNAARGATLAGAQGAAYAAADRGTARERLGAASRAARDPVTLGLGAAGGALATARRAKPPKTPSKDVDLLAREGVQMTPGQMRGGIAKTAEDAATSTPVLGDAVSARRTEGVETFSRAVVNRALKQVGAKLPDDIGSGTDAVKHAGDLLSKGYEDAIPGRAIRADPGFADDVRGALANIDTLTPESHANLARILDQRLTSRLPTNGVLDGNLYKLVQSELDYEVSRFAKATDPDQRAMGDAISGIQTALENAARRQDPAFASKIDALDRGWAELGRIETAASKSRDLSGVITPGNYAQSVRSADGRVRRRGVARGEALSQDLAGAGVRVLPSQMPDSGTAGRAAWGMVTAAPGAVLGAMTGGGVGAAAGIAGTAATLGAASRAYTPQAIQAANAALTARLPGSERQKALQALAEMAASDPKAAELYREVAARLSRAAGVAGGAQAGQQANPFAQP